MKNRGMEIWEWGVPMRLCTQTRETRLRKDKGTEWISSSFILAAGRADLILKINVKRIYTTFSGIVFDVNQ